MDHRQTSLRILLIILLPLFGACSVSRYNPLVREDGAPDVHVDIHQIPNATPRHEPRSASGNPEYYEVYGKRDYSGRAEPQQPSPTDRILLAFPAHDPVSFSWRFVEAEENARHVHARQNTRFANSELQA